MVCSAAPAVVFKIDEVLTFSCKLLSQQQKLNILSLFDTVLPKGINQAARTQGQIQGMDFHKLIKFTDAPFFFFSFLRKKKKNNFFFLSFFFLALFKVHYFPFIFQSVLHVRFSSDVWQSFDVFTFWRGGNQIANWKLLCFDLTCLEFHRKLCR